MYLTPQGGRTENPMSKCTGLAEPSTRREERINDLGSRRKKKKEKKMKIVSRKLTMYDRECHDDNF